MFKKNVAISGTHKLGGKDNKKFRQDVAKAFPNLSEEDITLVLGPPKTSIVTQLKLSNRAVAYTLEDNNPLFFDPSGRGDALLPTVYAFAKHPGLLPSLYTTVDVSSKIIGGADLFLQGLLVPTSGLPDFLAGSIRALSVPGNSVPFAIGKMAVSRVQAVHEGMKGRGLEILHVYGDLLWQMGDKSVPNEGFLKDRVLPLESQSEEAASTDELADKVASLDISHEQQQKQQQPPIESSSSGAAVQQQTTLDEPAHEQQDSASSNLDALLEQAAIGGLHTLKASELPIMNSDFYTKHMQPLKPAGVTFDFKQSKYKKLSKLLDYLEKEKLLKQKNIRKQDHITEVNRSHPLYTSWQPDTSQTKATSGSSNGGTNATSSSTAAGKIHIQLLYKAPTSIRPMFGESGARDKDRLYTEQEVSSALQEYAKRQGLISGGEGKSMKITIDPFFATTLWGKKQGPNPGEVFPYTALLNHLLSKLQLHHKIKRESGEEVVSKGGLKNIVVQAEKKHGRNQTTVTYMEGFDFVVEQLAGEFQRKFQTSCTVVPLPGNNEKGEQIVLQGDLHKNVAAYLVNAHGIDKKYIECSSKIKK